MRFHRVGVRFPRPKTLGNVLLFYAYDDAPPFAQFATVP